MSSSSVFRRTLPTSTRSRPSPTVTTTKATFLARNTTTNNLYYKPILTTQNPRFFSATTTTMSKEGVHNLSAKADFDTALAVKDTLMVLDCFATWCGPCKVIAPQVVKFSEQFPNARFYKIDVDEVPDVAQELGVRAMPTFFLFKNGEKIEEVVGANPKALEAAIAKHA